MAILKACSNLKTTPTLQPLGYKGMVSDLFIQSSILPQSTVRVLLWSIVCMSLEKMHGG